MNIFKNLENGSIDYRNYHLLSIKVDTSKYLPLFLLTQNLYMNDEYLKDEYDYYIKDLQKKSKIDIEHLKSKIKEEDYFSDFNFRFGMKYYRILGLRLKSQFKEFIFKKHLVYSSRWDRIVGLGTLFSRSYLNSKYPYIFEFGLFVKPEFATYVKCCLILDVDFEFDCLYFLADKRYETMHPNDPRYFIYKEMLKYCKNYDIQVDHIENLDQQISYKISDELKNLPTFKDVKNKLAEFHNLTFNNSE